ncbi:MAG TPA: Uma2 family endonuclease [Pirellulales bacterium]|nr:Uma2 family endonuclease [Pirellulales bacterium]
MATAERPVQTAAENRFVLYNIPWETFQLLRNADGLERTRMTYNEGMLELMSPSYRHEVIKKLLAQMVESFTVELRIPRRSLGSMTCQPRKKYKSLEPDECYYIANFEKIRGRHDINLDVDAPPDLAIEVEVSTSAIKKMGIYAALGVLEVWRWHDESLRSLVFGADGEYIETEFSPNLPMLRVKDLEPFLDVELAGDESQWLLAFRQWVQERFGA